jgi:hypothetical protein
MSEPSVKTLKVFLKEASAEAERFLKLQKKLREATDDDAIDLMADVDVSASVLKAKMVTINSVISRIIDRLDD